MMAISLVLLVAYWAMIYVSLMGNMASDPSLVPYSESDAYSAGLYAPNYLLVTTHDGQVLPFHERLAMCFLYGCWMESEYTLADGNRYEEWAMYFSSLRPVECVLARKTLMFFPSVESVRIHEVS